MDIPILTYLASFLLIGWGISHLFVTRSVVRGFGDISSDNRRVITMEWITEGVALVFIGSIVGIARYVDGASQVSQAVYWSSFLVLNVLSVVSLFTGFRNSFIAFKLCPFIFTGSSLLIVAGSMLNYP